MGLWQVGIDIQIEARRPAFDPAKQQVLDGIEAIAPSLRASRMAVSTSPSGKLSRRRRTWTYSRLPAAP